MQQQLASFSVYLSYFFRYQRCRNLLYFPSSCLRKDIFLSLLLSHYHLNAITYTYLTIETYNSNLSLNSPRPNNRFLQAETGPWGHLSPSPRSPTRTPAISPGTASSSSHLSPGTSPGGPSPTSPAGTAGSASGSRAPGPKQYRGRTSSMPAVPRHRVSRYLQSPYFLMKRSFFLLLFFFSYQIPRISSSRY